MLEWIPPKTELMQDVSAADWVLGRLRPWDLSSGVRLHSFAPDGFEAYARIFHPIRTLDCVGGRWAPLGAARGVELTPDIALTEVSGLDPRDGEAFDDLTPLGGQLPPAACEALARALRPHTRMPDRCWFCLWEGNGAFWSYAHTAPYVDDADRGEAARYLADARAQDDVLDPTPKVEAEKRSYLLFQGPLEAAHAFEPAGWYDSSNLWWPDDRSWIVVTEVDGFSTYVGADRSAIDDVLESSEMEAIGVPHDVHMDPGPYPPRWR